MFFDLLEQFSLRLALDTNRSFMMQMQCTDGVKRSISTCGKNSAVHTAQFLHCTHFLSSDTQEVAEVGLRETNAEIEDLVKGRTASDNAVP